MILIAPPPAIQTPAATPDDSTAVLTAPEWLKRPSPATIQRALPFAAAEDGVGGQAGIVCQIEADSRLSHCLGGDLKGAYGFNAAALSLAPSFRIRPGTRNGEPIERGRVVIPIRFEPPPGSALRVRPLWTGSPTAAEVKAALPVIRGVFNPGGLGVMRCTVSGDQLIDCRPAADPADALGRAAVKLAPRFVIADHFADGRPTSQAIFDIPVVFDGPKAKPVSPTIDAPPIWLRSPNPEQVAATAPAAAQQQGVSHVEADVACKVQPDGGLGSCAVTREAPVGAGAAQAALRLTQAYQTTTWLPEGRPTAGAPVALSFAWEVPAAAAAAARKAPTRR